MFVFLIFEILPFIIVFSVILIIITRAIKASKKTGNSLPEFKNTISNANDSDSFGNSEQDLSIYCEYCGSKFERVRKRCPSCGARVQKNGNNK